MFQKLFVKFINLLSSLTGKSIIYYNKNEHNALGQSATKSSLGFWYVGNVYDQSDLAYGIANSGVVEEEETKLVTKMLDELLKIKPQLEFYDIGANTGYYGMLAAHLGRGKIVVSSFEPLPEHVACLNESIRLNRFEVFVRVFQLALSDRVGKQKFYVAGTGSSLEASFLNDTKLPQVEVELNMLDQVISEMQLGQPDFIKIDVEGHELKVLNGAKEVIGKSVPIIFVEIAQTLKNLDRNFNNEDYGKTIDFLKKFGYQIFILIDSGIRPLIQDEEIDGVNMYLCLNPSRHGQIIEKIINN